MSEFQRGDRVKAKTDTVIGTVIDIYEDRKQAVVYFDGASCPSNEWIFALEKALNDDLAALQAENKRLRDALKTVLRKANSLAGYYPEPGDEREAYGMDAPLVFDDIRKAARVALEGGE